MIWDVTGGLGPGGLEAAWFGTAFTFLSFNFFNSLMEALLALVRSYGQTRTEELSSWKLFDRGKTYLVPSILTDFLINLQCFNFVRLQTGWLSGSFQVLGSLCCSQSSLFSLIYYVLCA